MQDSFENQKIRQSFQSDSEIWISDLLKIKL